MACLVREYTTAGGLYLCNHCHRRFNELLERVPATVKTAQATLANQGVQPRVGSVGTSAPGAPLNLDMAERLGAFERRITELAVWNNVYEEPSRTKIFTSTVRATEYLGAMSNHIRKRDFAGDIFMTLRNLKMRILSAADRPMAKHPLRECGALDFDDTSTVVHCTGTVMEARNRDHGTMRQLPP